MNIYLVVIGIVTIVYVILIVSFMTGWLKLKKYAKGQNDDPSVIFASIIIAAKNEENNLHQLFESIINQTLSRQSYEIIFINDHSIDDTLKIAQSYKKQLPNLYVVNLGETKGKKAAIQQGIKLAKGELIITTDADCTHHTNWLSTLVEFYKEKKPQMIIAPVIMKGESFFEKMQCLDFISLIATSAGAAGINQPIMCNAANMAFEKSVYNKLKDPHNNKFKSGDDIFLMLKIKECASGKIEFIKSNEAVCFTRPKATLKGFVNQRIRWVSKSKGYTDPFLILTSVIVLLINLGLLFSILLYALGKIGIEYFSLLFFAKSLIDISFLFQASSFFDLLKLLKFFIPTQLFNIILVPFLAVAGILSTGNWKGN